VVAAFRKKKVLHRYKAVRKYSRVYCATSFRSNAELLEGATSTLVKHLLDIKEKRMSNLEQCVLSVPSLM